MLLKNEGGALPLAKGEVLNLFGKGVHVFRYCAVGAGKINPRYYKSFLEAAEEEGVSVNQELVDFYACGEDVIPPMDMLKRARALSDTALMFITRPAGENRDLTSDPGAFDLSWQEENLLAELGRIFGRVIVVLNVGAPIGIRFLHRPEVSAVLYNGYGGMLAGEALLGVLMGRVNPSGRLVDTWAAEYGKIPSSMNFYDAAGGKPSFGADDGDVWIDTCYEEGLYVGYRYFESFPEAEPLRLPFGFGLSYTEFETSNVLVSFQEGVLRLEADIRNAGSRAGREVWQVYLGHPGTLQESPVKTLTQFTKTGLLQPGQQEHVQVEVPFAWMGIYDERRSAWVLEKGEYQVFAGGDARSCKLCYEFQVEKEVVMQQGKERMRPLEAVEEMTSLPGGKAWPTGEKSQVKGEGVGLSLEREENYPVPLPEIKENEELWKLVQGMDAWTKARLCICEGHG